MSSTPPKPHNRIPTLEEIKELPAGWRIEVYVAQLLFGWQYYPGDLSGQGWWQRPDQDYKIPDDWNAVPRYSRYDEDAQQVVRVVRKLGWFVSIHWAPEGETFKLGSGWDGDDTSTGTSCYVKVEACPHRHPRYLHTQFGFDDDWKPALCRAALRVVIAMKKQEGEDESDR